MSKIVMLKYARNNEVIRKRQAKQGGKFNLKSEAKVSREAMVVFFMVKVVEGANLEDNIKGMENVNEL